MFSHLQMMLSNPWVTFCQKHLCESSESGEAVHCLWILTFVIKEVFKDAQSQQAGRDGTVLMLNTSLGSTVFKVKSKTCVIPLLSGSMEECENCSPEFFNWT